MTLLFDVGNTHTHVGLADTDSLVQHIDLRTADWFNGRAILLLKRFVGRQNVTSAAVCSVVPRATPVLKKAVRQIWNLPTFALDSRSLRGLGIVYPKPRTIGPDRLANAVAARQRFGAPCLVVDFGTAVTFDVVDRRGDYVGGIIAPGLSAMTDYLHEKTALLPRIQIREIRSPIGKSTEEAMLVGAVHGYRGLVRELIRELKAELRVRRLPVVATGGYAALLARELPEISAVEPNLTLEGLRLECLAHRQPPALTSRRVRASLPRLPSTHDCPRHP